MKVCMLVDKPLPAERPTGMGVAAFNMAVALSMRNIRVFLLCRGSSQTVTSINSFLTVRTIRNYSRGNLSRFIEAIRPEMPDIVHVHSSSALPSLLLARMLGCSIVSHSHADWRMHPLRPALMRQVGYDFSHRIIAVSKDNKTAIEKNHHFPSAKVSVVYNGVDLTQFWPSGFSPAILSKYNLQNFKQIILSIGALQTRKGQHVVLKCMPAVVKKWPELVYVNVGATYDESYRRELLVKAEELGVASNVRFLTGIPNADLVALINAARVCIQPSIGEAFGLAVVEEMACGKPVLAFRSGSFPEIITDGVDGWLAEPNNVNEMISTLLEILEEPELLHRMGMNARDKVSKRFTWDSTASSLEVVYNEVLGDR